MSGIESKGWWKLSPDRVERLIEEELAHTMEEATDALERRWEELAHRHTASRQVAVGSGRVHGLVYTRDFVMRLLERGRGSVVPKRRKALRLKDGTFVARVGPMKPRRYLRKAARELRPVNEQRFARAAETIATRISRSAHGR